MGWGRKGRGGGGEEGGEEEGGRKGWGRRGWGGERERGGMGFGEGMVEEKEGGGLLYPCDIHKALHLVLFSVK